MPAIITATQLRSVLGVSSSLYNDAYLDEIINTAEGVILPLLVSYSSAVTYHRRTSNVATLTTNTPHNYIVGSSVVVSIGHQAFDGTKTVTAIGGEYEFSYASNGADVVKNAIIPHGTSYLSGYNAATIYAANPRVESAIYVVSIEVFQSRTAAGGQIEGQDFAPSPFKMGRSLLNRCSGLLGELLDTEAMAM